MRKNLQNGVRSRLCLLVFALTALPLQSDPAWAQDNALPNLASLDRTIEDAVVRGDVESLRPLYTEDFLFTHGTGQLQNKAQWLAQVARREFSSRVVSGVQVEMHGNAALTTGRLTVRQRPPADGHYILRYIRMYVRVEGRWRLASHRTIEYQDMKNP